MAEEDNTPLGRMKKLEAILDEYETRIGLPAFQEDIIDDDVRSYLSMNRNQIEKLSLEDCAIAAALLGGFAFHIQRCYNREMGRVNWADSVLKKTISGKESQYKGSWDSQYYQAIKEDSYTAELLKLKNYAQQRAERLTYLSNSIKNMSDLFINLQRARAMK